MLMLRVTSIQEYRKWTSRTAEPRIHGTMAEPSPWSKVQRQSSLSQGTQSAENVQHSSLQILLL